MKSHLKASFYTLGCRLNQAETALISQSFVTAGYEIVDFHAPADVCVINSCTVTEQADAKCRQIVRQVLRRNPDTFVAVVGCYAQTGWEALQHIDGIDLIVGTGDKLETVHLFDEPLKRPQPQVVRSRLSRAPFTISRAGGEVTTTRANLKIQDGCDFMCSFCVIPFARGRARSRDFHDIRREATALCEAGYHELVLTGVNIGTYSFEGKTFMDVVRMLLDIPELGRLRISSIEPTTIPSDLLNLMAEDDRLCPHLHIPLQSGSDTILASMKRQYAWDEIRRFLETAQERVPGILLGTDIMVGFPGETEADFQQSCEALKSSPLTYAHVFTYSERQHTAAARLSNKIDPRIKKERSKRLHRISEEKKRLYYKNWIGRQVRVLLEEQDEIGHWLGYADNYLRVAVAGPQLKANQFVLAEIAGVRDGLALGRAA